MEFTLPRMQLELEVATILSEMREINDSIKDVGDTNRYFTMNRVDGFFAKCVGSFLRANMSRGHTIYLVKRNQNACYHHKKRHQRCALSCERRIRDVCKEEYDTKENNNRTHI